LRTRWWCRRPGAAAERPVGGSPMSHASDPRETFSRSRGLPLQVLDWFGVRWVEWEGRPALTYATIQGIDRLKFLEHGQEKYRWAKPGGRVGWYGLAQARELLTAGCRILYIVNGEPSVWACRAAGVAAVSNLTGEGTPPSDAMVQELA